MGPDDRFIEHNLYPLVSNLNNSRFIETYD
ncbi:MAG: hypothetical protein ACI845_001650 [Gammaproteobacteria bacterium]